MSAPKTTASFLYRNFPFFNHLNPASCLKQKASSSAHSSPYNGATWTQGSTSTTPSIYIRWFETARIACFQELIRTLDFGDRRPDDFILAEISCRYLFPVTFPDVVEAACRFLAGSLSQHSLLMQQRIISRRHNRIVAEGTARLVTYDYQTLQKTPVSETLRRYLLTLKPTDP